MRAQHADRIWMGIGALGAILMLAIAYLLLISPLNGQTRGLHEQVEATETRLISLRQQLADLQDQQAKMPQFQAELRRHRAALPVDSGVPDFLRQLQNAGDTVGAEVTSMNVGEPTQTAGGVPVYSLPMTVTANGSPDQLSRFLDQLQQVQPRAVLVEATNLAAAQTETSGKTMDLTVTLRAFVAPGVGKPAPTATD